MGLSRGGIGRYRPGEFRAGLVWAGVFMALGGGYGVLAPVVDDWRSASRAMEAGCRVARVIDGDTVDLACRGRERVRARIVGYDAPERFSPGCAAEAAAAERAHAALAAWVRGAGASEVAFLGRDRWDRALVDLRLDGRRVAAAMVEAGHGRRYFGSLRGGWC